MMPEPQCDGVTSLISDATAILTRHEAEAVEQYVQDAEEWIDHHQLALKLQVSDRLHGKFASVVRPGELRDLAKQTEECDTLLSKSVAPALRQSSSDIITDSAYAARAVVSAIAVETNFAEQRINGLLTEAENLRAALEDARRRDAEEDVERRARRRQRLHRLALAREEQQEVLTSLLHTARQRREDDAELNAETAIIRSQRAALTAARADCDELRAKAESVLQEQTLIADTAQQRTLTTIVPSVGTDEEGKPASESRERENKGPSNVRAEVLLERCKELGYAFRNGQWSSTVKNEPRYVDPASLFQITGVSRPGTDEPGAATVDIADEFCGDDVAMPIYLSRRTAAEQQGPKDALRSSGPPLAVHRPNGSVPFLTPAVPADLDKFAFVDRFRRESTEMDARKTTPTQRHTTPRGNDTTAQPVTGTPSWVGGRLRLERSGRLINRIGGAPSSANFRDALWHDHAVPNALRNMPRALPQSHDRSRSGPRAPSDSESARSTDTETALSRSLADQIRAAAHRKMKKTQQLLAANRNPLETRTVLSRRRTPSSRTASRPPSLQRAQGASTHSANTSRSISASGVRDHLPETEPKLHQASSSAASGSDDNTAGRTAPPQEWHDRNSPVSSDEKEQQLMAVRVELDVTAREGGENTDSGTTLSATPSASRLYSERLRATQKKDPSR